MTRPEAVAPPRHLSFRWVVIDPYDQDPSTANSTLVNLRLSPDAAVTRVHVTEQGFDQLSLPAADRTAATRPTPRAGRASWSASATTARPLAADEGGKVTGGREGSLVVDDGLHLPAHVLDDIVPGAGGLILMVAGQAG